MSSDAATDRGTDRDVEGANDGEDADPAELPLPPGPDGWPVIGQTRAIASDPFEAYETRLAPHGDVVRFTLAGTKWTTLLHPDHVQRALLDEWEQFGKYSFEEFGGGFAEDGLLFAEGEQWSRQREQLQDAFTMDRLQSYADAMTGYTVEMLEGWDDGEVVAADEAFADLSLRILTHSLFDIDLAERGSFVTEFATTVNERQMATSLLSLLPLWVPTPENRRYRRAQAEFEAFVEGLVDERRGDEDAYDDLLSLMLTAEDDRGRTMSETEVRDQMVTFLFAGHETTSLALAYTLQEVAEHDDVRERLDDELADVCGGAAPTVGDLPQLSYTERVIKEALRLYPPAFVLFRKTREDVAMGGYRIPAGTRVTLPQFMLHRDERWWDDPEQFRPDRFTDEAAADRHDYAYFPFGGGPRHCIGMRFAMMELKLVLATLLQRREFDLESDPDPALAPGATLHPEAPIEVRVSER